LKGRFGLSSLKRIDSGRGLGKYSRLSIIRGNGGENWRG
jgi:hypothetical protein